jgi:hypothetical protein
MGCLFCCNTEPEFKSGATYKPASGIDFTCSLCVQMFLAEDQKDLKMARSKALEKGFTNKAMAIESFLILEGKDEQRRPVSKNRGRHINRKRIVRAIGDKEKRIGRSKVPA